MLNRIKNRLLRLLGQYKYLDSKYYVEYARSQGCNIGEGTEFYGTKKVDCSPMISIGKNCKITDGVRIVYHTGDSDILQRHFGEEGSPDVAMKETIDIGDNVFIGDNSIVLPNTQIGDNCIIGAGSVVAKDIPPESVAAGNPCDVIMSLKEYRDRRVASQPEMVEQIVRRYENQDYPMVHTDVMEYIRTHSDTESPKEFAQKNIDK